MWQIEKMRCIPVCCVIETGKEYTWAQIKADPEADGPISISVPISIFNANKQCAILF